MDDYNNLYFGAGAICSALGLAATLYGVLMQDMEKIVGGFSLAYIGRSLKADCFDIERNKILKTNKTLDERVDDETPQPS